MSETFESIIAGQFEGFGAADASAFEALDKLAATPLPDGWFKACSKLPGVSQDVEAYAPAAKMFKLDKGSVYDLTYGRSGGSAFVDFRGNVVAVQATTVGDQSGTVDPAWSHGVSLNINGQPVWVPWSVWCAINQRLEDRYSGRRDNPARWRF